MSPPGKGTSRIALRACALGALAAVAIAGCGGGSSSSTGHPATTGGPATTGHPATTGGPATTSHPATTPGSTPGPESLVSRLPPISAFRQLHPLGLPSVIRSPIQWTGRGGLPGTPGQADAARLTRLGFIAGVRELLGSEQRSVSEVSATVEQFRTAAAARSELAYRSTQARAIGSSPGYTFSPLHPPGIPGAVGYAIRQPGTASDVIMFAAGPYFYLIESLVPTGSPSPVTLAQLEAAAAGWYRRVS
jgi:hypothetical protein